EPGGAARLGLDRLGLLRERASGGRLLPELRNALACFARGLAGVVLRVLHPLRRLAEGGLHFGRRQARREGDLLRGARVAELRGHLDRKSTRLNSSHVKISYAVFCLKNKRSAVPTPCKTQAS